jgi:hypothetical protein
MAEPAKKVTKKALTKVWAKRMPQPIPNWHVYQGNTNDCGPYCATIAANALRDADVLDAPTLARAMEDAPKDMKRLLPSRVSGWATFPWGIVYALRQLGFKARWRLGASLNRLEKNLERGRVSIVIVGDPLNFHEGRWAGWAHYKILYAQHPVEGLAFVDPMAPEVYSFQDVDTFKEEWTWMGRNIIEVWDEDEDDEDDEDDVIEV